MQLFGFTVQDWHV